MYEVNCVYYSSQMSAYVLYVCIKKIIRSHQNIYKCYWQFKIEVFQTVQSSGIYGFYDFYLDTKHEYRQPFPLFKSKTRMLNLF